MKTRKNSILAIILICVLAMNFTNKVNATKTITIQAVDKNVSVDALSQSAKIISARLHDFTVDAVEISVVPEKNCIQVTVSDNADVATIESLMTQKGEIGFYRVCEHSEAPELLKNNKQLFAFLNDKDTNSRSPQLGCCTLSQKEKVDEYLNTVKQTPDYKLMWSRTPDNAEICLFALYTEKGNGLPISGADIEQVVVKQDKSHLKNYVEFSFKGDAIKRWADITRQNIGNSIAIVLDNTVLSSPRVNASIDGGKCTITGNFSEKEVRLFAAFGNNGTLPLSFTLLK